MIYRGIKKLIEEKQNDIHDDEVSVGGALLYKYKLGCLAGGLSAGLIGIGGGVIFTMLNRIVLGLGPHKAAGTSYLIVMRVVPVAIVSHLLFNPTLIDEISKFNTYSCFTSDCSCNRMGGRQNRYPRATARCFDIPLLNCRGHISTEIFDGSNTVRRIYSVSDVSSATSSKPQSDQLHALSWK